jgi:putative ABC transport system permease protein
VAPQTAPLQVAGVVDDVREYAVNVLPPPIIYLPQAQAGVDLDQLWYRSFGLLSALVIRTSGTQDLSVSVRRAVEQVDPQQPIVSVAPMSALVGESTAFSRMLMLLMSSFAALALVLTSVGLYALLSYHVAQRAREIGIRMALSAGSARVLRMVVREGIVLVGAGLVAGLVGAIFAARMLSRRYSFTEQARTIPELTRLRWRCCAWWLPSPPMFPPGVRPPSTQWRPCAASSTEHLPIVQTRTLTQP